MSTLDAAIYNESRKARDFSERVASRRTLIYRKTVTASEVITLPAGYYDIIAVGNGGSGGRGGNNGRGTGGGGPAWARDWGKFDTPTAVTFTVGAIAAGLAASSTPSNGNTGGTASVTGITNPISLTGGEGGKFAVVNATCLGGLGGVATGGKIRANGGRGGNITNTGNGAKATGGGALDLFCQGSDKTRGGDINGTYTVGQATGGGGIGGHGGDMVSNNAGPATGGDARDDATDDEALVGPSLTGVSTLNYVPAAVEVTDVLLAYPGLVPTAAGGSGGAVASGGGAGVSGSAMLGGGAGVSGVSTAVQSLSVIRGGGSGGVASNNASNSTGNGGAAFFVVSVYSDQ